MGRCAAPSILELVSCCACPFMTGLADLLSRHQGYLLTLA